MSRTGVSRYATEDIAMYPTTLKPGCERDQKSVTGLEANT